jgi:DNA-binding IclR family transcriptional regulator
VAGSRLLGSTLKCLALVDTMAVCGRAAGVSELAEKTGSWRGTVHQQLSTLTAAGWVERVDGGRYRLTLRAARVFRAALEQASIGERIRAPLEALAAATSEAISIAVLDKAEALIVQRVESGQVLRVDVGLGSRMPLSASASGRVIVAFSPANLVSELRAQGVSLPSDDVIFKTRSEGVAVSVDEYRNGLSAVATPVFDGSGRFVGALSAAMPTGRLELIETTERVKATAEEINRMLSEVALLGLESVANAEESRRSLVVAP